MEIIPLTPMRTSGCTFPTLHIQSNKVCGFNGIANTLFGRNRYLLAARLKGVMYMAASPEFVDGCIDLHKRRSFKKIEFVALVQMANPGLEFPATFRLDTDNPVIEPGLTWYPLVRIATKKGSRSKKTPSKPDTHE